MQSYIIRGKIGVDRMCTSILITYFMREGTYEFLQHNFDTVTKPQKVRYLIMSGICIFYINIETSACAYFLLRKFCTFLLSDKNLCSRGSKKEVCI